MNNIVKQITVALTALGVTVCGVAALATNVSASSSKYTAGYNKNLATTECEEPTMYDEVTTYYPDEIIEDISLENNSVDAGIIFKNNALPSVGLDYSMPQNSNLIYGTLKDVPPSDSPYYFVIDYTTVHASGVYHGIKTDGNEIYYETGGTYFAFFNKTKADLTFVWDKANANNVSITGGNVVMMKSQIPFYGNTEDDLTEPYTLPAWVTTDPYIEPVSTSPEDPYIATTAPSETKYIIGDVNMDGVVDGADAGTLSRFTSGWKNYDSRIVNPEAADINRDGKVNGADAGILSRYISEWKGYAGYIHISALFCP